MKFSCQDILKMTEAQLKFTNDVSLQDATAEELHEALGKSLMMAISDNWSHSKAARMPKRKAYYISAEYLIGRLVYSNMFNLGLLDELKQVFAEKGVDLAILEDIEDAALGNGGLGRLAACFLDSAASTNIPLSGYGLRYRFGLFKQKFDANGSQMEDVCKSNNLPEGLPLFTLQGGFDLKKLRGIYRLMMLVMSRTVAKKLAAKPDRTPDEDDMLDLFQNGGNRVSLANLAPVLAWFEGGCV